MQPQDIVLETSFRGRRLVFAGHHYYYAGQIIAGDLVRWAYLPVI